MGELSYSQEGARQSGSIALTRGQRSEVGGQRRTHLPAVVPVPVPVPVGVPLTPAPGRAHYDASSPREPAPLAARAAAAYRQQTCQQSTVNSEQ